VSGDGGAVLITAADARVGSIDTSGSTNPIRRNFFGYVSDADIYYFKGGDVTVKTDLPFKSGEITTDGVVQGAVDIRALDTVPSTGGSEGTNLTLPPIQERAKPNVIRQRILVFTEAQRLAGQKLTAQEISAQLNIPLELAQIAVLIPVGDNIKVTTPEIQRFSVL
jgi:hypothetical protein